MTTVRELCNTPAGQITIMEMFENGEKVAQQEISSLTCRELSWLINYQEDIGRTWSYKTINLK